MRNDTNKDLDLLFQEGLADARVKAPRGVWKAVSARLDSAAPAAAAAAPKRSWLLWGAPAFAFAAAAVAVVFFVGTTEKTIIQSGEEILSVVEQPSGPVAEEILVIPSEAKESSSPRAGYVPKEIQTPDQITVLPSNDEEISPLATLGRNDKEEPSAEVISSSSPVISSSSPVIPSSSPVIPSEAKESVVKEESSQSFWNELEAEEASASGHKQLGQTAIKLGGTLTGNDAHFKAARPAFSSGYSPVVTETSVSVYGIPVSLGLSARYHFAEKLAVSAGVNWSFLSRTFQGKYKTAEGNFTHNMQYIGVPVSLSYDVVNSKTLLFYCYAGGSAEKAISSKYFIYSDSAAPLYTEKVPGLQYGLFGGIGVEFRVSDLLGLYVDPCVKYYFPGNQPKSIRTDKPLMFSFEAGLRFNL